MKTFQLLAGLFVLLHQCFAQTKFIIYVVEYTPPSLTPITFRCLSTIISSHHVLSTASCVSVSSTSSLALQIHVASTDSSVFATGIKTILAERTYIHPEYNQGQKRNMNIAVVKSVEEFSPTIVISLSRGGLSADSNCQLYGWGTALTTPRRDSVIVKDPPACDPNFTQIFCTIFDSATDASCSAYEGSPVVCKEGSVDGILINDRACEISGNRYMLQYHSVSEFREFIDSVVGSGIIPLKNSLLLILSALITIFTRL